MALTGCIVRVQRGPDFPRDVIKIHDPLIQQLVIEHLSQQPGVRTVVPEDTDYRVVMDLSDHFPTAAAALNHAQLVVYMVAEGRAYALPLILEVW